MSWHYEADLEWIVSLPIVQKVQILNAEVNHFSETK